MTPTTAAIKMHLDAHRLANIYMITTARVEDANEGIGQLYRDPLRLEARDLITNLGDGSRIIPVLLQRLAQFAVKKGDLLPDCLGFLGGPPSLGARSLI